MKNKPDKHSQERLADIKQAAEEILLPESIELPTPVQLAQIAAGFGVQAPPADAVRKAVSLYIRAIAFKAKHDNAPVLDLAAACDDELAAQLSRAAMEASLKRTYLLEPDKHNDEARRELTKGGLPLRKAKSVLENLREIIRLINMGRFVRQNTILVTAKNGKPLWLYGTPAESEADKVSLAKCCSVTRNEYDHRTEAIAKQHGWREADHEANWKRELARITERRADGRVVYHLPSLWLRELLDWKKSLKRTGGVKSRQVKKSSENS